MVSTIRVDRRQKWFSVTVLFGAVKIYKLFNNGLDVLLESSCQVDFIGPTEPAVNSCIIRINAELGSDDIGMVVDESEKQRRSNAISLGDLRINVRRSRSLVVQQNFNYAIG